MLYLLLQHLLQNVRAKWCRSYWWDNLGIGCLYNMRLILCRKTGVWYCLRCSGSCANLCQRRRFWPCSHTRWSVWLPFPYGHCRSNRHGRQILWDILFVSKLWAWACIVTFKLVRCAQALNPASIAGPASTVCTNHKPFKICTHSDNVEYAMPAPLGEGTLANNRGFKISMLHLSAGMKLLVF